MRSLESRLAKLESLRPAEPLILRLGRQGEDLTPEEVAVLEAEARRRIEAGEDLVLTMRCRAEAERLGAPAPTAKKPAQAIWESGSCATAARPSPSERRSPCRLRRASAA